jgi:hypothetical protein
MGILSSVYNSVVTFVGEEIVHPAIIGLGYTNDEIADPEIGPKYFHDLADFGDRADEHYMNGNPVAGFVAANAGAAEATGSAGIRLAGRGVEAAKDELASVFNNTVKNGIWNNLIMTVIGGLAGSILGNIFGSILGNSIAGPFGGIGSGVGQIVGIVGGVAAGWALGDQIMESVGMSVESKNESASPVPVHSGYSHDLTMD